MIDPADWDDVQRDAPARSQEHGGARRRGDYIALTKAARARFDTLAAESIEAVFQAVLTAATQDGDMAAAKLLIDRVIPSRRGAPVSPAAEDARGLRPRLCRPARRRWHRSAHAGRSPDHLGHCRQARRAVPIDRAGQQDRCPESAARRRRRCPATVIADPPPVRDRLTATGAPEYPPLALRGVPRDAG